MRVIRDGRDESVARRMSHETVGESMEMTKDEND